MASMLVLISKPREDNTASLLRRIVTITRSHAGVLHAPQFHFDLTKAAVASLVRWIVAETVLGADLVRDLCKRRARFAQTRGGEILASGITGHLVHLAPRQIVELPADIHALKLAH